MKEILIAMVAVIGFTACEKDIINPVDPFPIDTTTTPVDTTPQAIVWDCTNITSLKVDNVYRPDIHSSFATGKYGPTWINGDHTQYQFCGAFNALINFHWDQGNPGSSSYALGTRGYRAGFMNGIGVGGNMWVGTWTAYVSIVWKNGWVIFYSKGGNNNAPGIYHEGSYPVYLNDDYPGVIFNDKGEAVLLVTQK